MSDEKLKLHEVVAVRKGVKSRTYGELTELFKKAQKSDLYGGMSREFQSKDDDGETFPPEDKKVQVISDDVLKQVRKLRMELFDIEATQEYGNLEARGDVKVDGETVLADVPVTLLIFLEKELNDLRTFIEAMPTLDEARTWQADPNSKLHRSETAVTHKTKKVQRPIVLYDAVIKDDHAIPAQTQLITEDVVTGHWHTTYLSARSPRPGRRHCSTGSSSCATPSSARAPGPTIARSSAGSSAGRCSAGCSIKPRESLYLRPLRGLRGQFHCLRPLRGLRGPRAWALAIASHPQP